MNSIELKLVIKAFVVFVYCCSCGAKNNVLAHLVTKEDENSHEYLLEEATISLNAGNYERAVEFASKARALDPDNEATAVVLSHSYLALAGVDPFSLAKKMLEDNEAKKTQVSEGSSEDEGEKSSSSNPLDPLKSILGLSEAELAGITMPNNEIVLETGSVVKGAPTEGLFVDYPILLPKTATAARQSSSGALRYIASAINAICPFVANEARILGDTNDLRHTPDVCPPAKKNTYLSGKSHFIWSFAHLTEAIAFNSVVMFDPTGEGPNLIRRTDAISDPQTIGMSEYIGAMNELASVLEVVFPTEISKSQDSMLQAMVNDLKATSKGFDLLPGMPASMVANIKSSLSKLEEQTQKIKAKTTTSGTDASSSALKDTLTEKLGETLEAQIEERVASGEVTPEEKAEVCAAYAQISSEAIDICNASEGTGEGTDVDSGNSL